MIDLTPAEEDTLRALVEHAREQVEEDFRRTQVQLRLSPEKYKELKRYSDELFDKHRTLDNLRLKLGRN